MIALIIQLLSGAVGGNIAGALLKNINLGPIGNSIAGILGGAVGGQLLHMILGSGATAAATAITASGSGLDLSSILSSIGGGGIGGAVLMAIVGLVRARMAKS